MTYSECERALLVIKDDLAEEAADLEVLLESDLGPDGNVAPERVPLCAAQLEGREKRLQESKGVSFRSQQGGAREWARTTRRLFISVTSFLAES